MPTYPDINITIDGQNITWSRLSNNPVFLQRVLDRLVLRRLVSNRVLAGRVDISSSGTLLVEQSGPILANRTPEPVAPLALYPKTTVPVGTLAYIQALKEGLGFDVADETIRFGRGDRVTQDLMMVVNQQALQADARALSLIASTVTNTFAATAGAWSTAGADPFTDLMLAKAQGDTLNKGYNYRAALLSPTLWAYALTRAKIIDRLPREGAGTLLVSGNVFSIAGFTFWSTTSLPPNTPAMIFDPDMLGGIAYADLQDGYTGSATPSPAGDFSDAATAGVQVKRIRLDERDGWTINTRLMQAPYIQNPDAAIKLTGVTA